jgi:hypothetical protein
MEMNMKRIAFEPSNSWLKRCCERGTLLIQAGWNSPPRNGRKTDDNENPTVVSGNLKRQYGRKALSRTGASCFDFSKKEDEAQRFLEAVLLPEDDGQDIELVVSHWDATTLDSLQDRLKGDYTVIRNGHKISCRIKETVTLFEGEGTYLAAKAAGNLNPGDTLVIEIGFGSSEFWMFDCHGNPEGDPITEFSVSRLVEAIANDDNTRILFGVTAGEKPDTPRISALLKGASAEDAIDLNVWRSIRKRHVTEWAKAFNAYLTKHYAREIRTAGTIVLTGGGAEILRPVYSKVPKFHVPHEAQTASVKGAFHFGGRG